MRSELFDYHLPPERIAQEPAEPRDSSRLMVVPSEGPPTDHLFSDLPDLLEAGDLLVLNDTRVLPARLMGRRLLPDGSPGGAAEVLLLRELEPDSWEALVRPARRMKSGAVVQVEGVPLRIEVEKWSGSAERKVRLRFEEGSGRDWLQRAGAMPLPPYIRRPLADPERYQTIYSREEGSAAAPTAGLHFTEAVLDRLRLRGIEIAAVTLHVGLATFKPMQVEEIEDHAMHQERYYVPDATRRAIERCAGRVIAAGTTTARCLESAWLRGEPSGETDLFIRPGFRWQVVDRLLTNFHTPRSTLLVMVGSFAGMETIRTAYAEAVRRGYRFLSFGDAMLLDREQME